MTLSVFTCDRDPRPHLFFPGQVPDRARYARVLVLARDMENAAARLEVAGLRRYTETLRPASSSDGPAQAVMAYAQYAGQLVEYPVFISYRVDEDTDGRPYRAPRFFLARVVGGSLVAAGRLRAADGGTTDGRPDIKVVPEDYADDPVPMPAHAEAPDTAPTVAGRPTYPAGALGDVASELDDQLVSELDRMQDRIEATIREIRAARKVTDPRYAWTRDSQSLLAMSADLARLAADARVVEAALRTNPR